MSKKRNRSDLEKEPKRDTWSNQVEFMLSLLGYAVGPGNVLRFPYLTLRNGGGAFLIPYFLCLFLSGIPIFLTEVYMGQCARKSCIACWDRFSPIMKGNGYTMLLMSFMFAALYQAVVAWSLYYMAASFTWTLPWTSCNETWNTPNCILTVNNNDNENTSLPSRYYGNLSFTDDLMGNDSLVNTTARPMGAAEEYWQYNVLRQSSSIEEIGLPNWKLFLAHLVGVIVIYLCLSKGVRSIGKVIWVTAITPYILILIFLVRAVLLPGSLEGIKFYLMPDWSVLTKAEPWVLGFVAIFYSLGTGYGCLHSMASYNEPNHNFLREALAIPIANCLTSFISGFVVFSCAGFLAHRTGMPVEEAMTTGPGLAFVSYPEVTSHLPGGPIWSFLFFLMLFLLCLDSLFGSIEGCVSGIVDEFNLSKRQHHLVLIIVLFIDLLFGIILFTNAGMYFYQLIDWYFSVIGIFLVSALEMMAVMWIYGYKRVYDDLEVMIGSRPLKFVVVPLIGIVQPLLLLIAMFFSITRLSKPVYGTYEYPDWSEKFGWSFAVLMILPVFIYPLVKILQATRKGNTRANLAALIRTKAEDNKEDGGAMNGGAMNGGAMNGGAMNDVSVPMMVNKV